MQELSATHERAIIYPSATDETGDFEPTFGVACYTGGWAGDKWQGQLTGTAKNLSDARRWLSGANDVQLMGIIRVDLSQN